LFKGITSWNPMAGSILILLGALGAGLLLNYLLIKTLRKWSSKTKTPLDDSMLKHWIGPSKVIIPLLLASLLFPVTTFPVKLAALLKHIIGLGLIISIAWLLICSTSLLEDIILSRYDIHVRDNLEARKIYTQVNVLKKVITVIILTLTLAAILMSFNQVKKFGISLLASAGVLGIIIGFAAQRSIATLLAGLQIAITQPIRLDDVVIVEGEWGWIEEITLTYVVVRIWDLRRLVVPITHFIEKPFQNWTRISADLLATVYIYTDYSIPVEKIREELGKILENSPLWDKKVGGLQVTNATEHTMELRALMSAPDSSAAWDLRCHVREKLIEYIQNQYPQALPKVRAEVHSS
jgi:small-conductance mechanosensitive channel